MEAAEEDRASLKSDGKTPTALRETLGKVKSLKNSIRKAAEKNPLSPNRKGSKGKDKTDPTCPPPSPSPSAGSPVVSPLKNIGGFFQKKDEDKSESPSQKNKGLSRSNTDPNIGSTSLLNRGAQIRRSLFGTKKEKKDQLVPLSEGPLEERKETPHTEEEQERGDGEEEPQEEEMEEVYILPELPHTPLSVMQINKLIEKEVLEEAYLNLLALRLEFHREQSQSGPDAPITLAKKEKDLNLLYTELREKIWNIVRDSNSLPARNKKLLEFVARIVQEEERRDSEPGGLPGSWMGSWRSAVQDGVRAKVERVPLETREQNQSWLAVHLGLLGKMVVEDLESVRRELRWSYPPSFRVFSEYVQSYHRVLGQHLQRLEKQTTESKDIHALLNWILNRYKSESIMGHVSLQVDMRDESKDLQLDPGFLLQLKDKYCNKVKEDLRFSLDNIINLEHTDFWKDRKEPEREEGSEGPLISDLHMDVWTMVKGLITTSRTIEAELEQRVTCSCLQEIKNFPKRFEQEYRRHCDPLRPQQLWSQYHITYINSFTTLHEHMEGYRSSCPAEVEALSKEVKWFNTRLLQDLQDQFKDHMKIPLRRMMTRKWLSKDEDFQDLYRRTEELSQHCSVMKGPSCQELSSRMHLHVCQEYLGQLMKNNYSCKSRKHEKAANKIRAQWGKLQELFRNMESSHEWLYPVGGMLCDIIGQKHTHDIKDHLKPIVQHCPDFGRKHLVAVLWFRGLVRGREHRLIFQKFSELKIKGDKVDKSRVLFSEMQVTVNTDCLSNMPYSCFSFFMPRD